MCRTYCSMQKWLSPFYNPVELKKNKVIGLWYYKLFFGYSSMSVIDFPDNKESTK